MVLLAVIVLVILFQIIGIVSSKLGLDPIWVKVIWLVVLLITVIWAFGLFGVTQPIIK
jgi:hypothetical protein